MPVISLEGLDIKFPYEPYEIQKDLMSCVIKCIKNREHGLLESPTGTGKTASLLCASLAWQQTEKDRVRRTLQSSAAAATYHAHAPEAAQGEIIGFSVNRTLPKIIYATRTHTQITQAVRELKRTQYNKVKTVTLGSRDIMCIHDEVSRLPEASTKIMACHIRVLGRTCAYYNNVQKVKEQFTVVEQKVLDIEELVAKGKGSRFCPFFMSKELVADADLIFMPYNYLLDPKLRTSHGVDLKNCIIILDEAHNITKVCEDSSSFELKSSVIAQCIREVTRAINEFNDLTEDLKKSTKDLSMGEIVKLKATLLELEKHLDEAPFCLDIPDSGKTVEGVQVLRCFFACGLTVDQFGRWVRILDAVSSFLVSNSTEATGCDKFAGVLRVLSTRLLYGHPELFLSSYTVKVELETRGNTPGVSNLLSFAKPKGKVFHFWCMNPAVGLDLLLQHNPRCIMLASGTLSPIDFLENELQLHFPVKIQNPHIITASQLYAAVLKVGPGDVKLSSAFNNRGKSEYITSLGSVIREVCGIVPEGVLVFFPSYSAMDQAVDYWKENGHWGTIASEKSIYVEPRGKRALDDLMNSYYTDAQRGSGSCLMAVCRGKVSEGLDFTDGKCRAVIMTGLPYAPYKNEQVTSKIKYLDSKANNSQGVKGNAWYSIDAVRALNQAVGRIIRHRDDFGAILLCDDRCDYRDVNQNLSKWVSSRLVRPSWPDMKVQLSNFFKSYGICVTGRIQLSSSSSSSRTPGMSGSSFQFNGQSRKIHKMGETIKINDEPEPEFSKLYDGKDSEAISKSQLPTRRLFDLASLGATTSPIVSFTVPSSSAAPVEKVTPELKKNGEGGLPSSNPRKKIKLVAESKYSRIADRPSRAPSISFPKSGITEHHVKRQQEEPVAPRPLFSSTQARKPIQSTSTPAVSKTFENVKDFGDWMKGKLSTENYRKVMGEFKEYKEKKDIMTVLKFGKKIFPKSEDYKSYMNGLRLVSTAADRSIINDMMSSYDVLEES